MPTTSVAPNVGRQTVVVKVTDTGRFDRAMRDLASKLGKSATLQVGFLDGATEADGTSVALIASIQEFGAPSRGIPPRPFMRTTIAEHSPTWGQQLTKWSVVRSYDDCHGAAQECRCAHKFQFRLACTQPQVFFKNSLHLLKHLYKNK